MNLIERVKNMIVTPKTEWTVIDGESDTLSGVITKYVVPLAAVGAICTFIGYAFIGIDYGFFRMRGMEWGIKMAVISIVSSIIGVIITAFVVDALAPSFGSEKNINKSAQLVAYSYTPAFVGALLTIFPAISMIGGLFGLYGIYLMYLGLGPLKKTPEDKKVIYLVITIVVLIAVYFVIGLILGSVLGTRISAASSLSL
jgi:Yip1 domain